MIKQKMNTPTIHEAFLPPKKKKGPESNQMSRSSSVYRKKKLPPYRGERNMLNTITGLKTAKSSLDDSTGQTTWFFQ